MTRQIISYGDLGLDIRLVNQSFVLLAIAFDHVLESELSANAFQSQLSETLTLFRRLNQVGHRSGQRRRIAR